MLFKQTKSMPRPGGVFYGWWIVAGVFVAEMFAIGSTSFAFGTFVVPVSEEFDLPRATANTGLVLILLGMGLSAPLVGRLLDRFPARWVLVGGALCMGGGLIGIALVHNLNWIAALLLLLVGPGAGAIGPLSAATVVSRWFRRQRGRALGVTSVATSLGGTVLVPVIGFNLELFGWRGALMIQGVAIITVVSLVSLAVIRDRPQVLGLQPDGESGSKRLETEPQPDSPWSVPTLLCNRDFWFIVLAVAPTFAVSQSLLATLVPYAIDLEISPQRASALVSVLAFSSIIGKLTFGAIADRFDKRWLLLLIILFILMQLGLLLAKPGFWTLFALLGITGLATGGELPVWAALVADRFGSASYGLVMGCMNLMVTLAGLVSIRYIGQAYDLYGNYDFALFMFMGCVVSAMVAVLCISYPNPRLPANVELQTE